jgi:hypothetical protein
MAADKITNWTQAFADAKERPDGELVNVHGATLRAMEKRDSAYRRDGKWYVTGMGPGPVEEPKVAKVEFTVRDHAQWAIPMDVTGAPDTSNPEVPSAGTVRPSSVYLHLFPNAQTRAWEVTTVHVVGPKVKNGEVVTKRDYTVLFADPLETNSVAPEWLREISREWTDRANSEESLPEALSSAEISRQVPRSPQRTAFDSALRTLLIRENLDGTEWVINRLMEKADEMPDRMPDSALAEFLKLTAYSLCNELDKRAAELAAREH